MTTQQEVTALAETIRPTESPLRPLSLTPTIDVVSPSFERRWAEGVNERMKNYLYTYTTGPLWKKTVLPRPHAELVPHPIHISDVVWVGCGSRACPKDKRQGRHAGEEDQDK